MPAVWEFSSVTVQRRYNNKTGRYDWNATACDMTVTGWDSILECAAAAGWELVSVCVDGHHLGPTSAEASDRVPTLLHTTTRPFLSRKHSRSIPDDLNASLSSYFDLKK